MDEVRDAYPFITREDVLAASGHAFEYLKQDGVVRASEPCYLKCTACVIVDHRMSQ